MADHHDPGGPTGTDLLGLDTPELLERAAARRSATTGTRVTYSPKVFIPLTMLCRDQCGYCTFAQPPARLDAPYLSPDQVLQIARRGARAGCHEALFTLGERPELRYPAAAEWLAANGYASTVDYLAAMCKLVVEETGLLPHANAGALHPDELATLRAVAPSQGMMVETLRDDLDCHRNAPDKAPRAPPRHPGRRGPPRHPVHHRHPGRHRRERGGPGGRPVGHRRGPPAPRTHPGGDRPELPAQAGHGHVEGRPRAPTRRSIGPSPWPASSCRPTSTSRPRRT